MASAIEEVGGEPGDRNDHASSEEKLSYGSIIIAVSLYFTEFCISPALVLSNSGKRMDDAVKKYVKQVTGRHNDTELHLAAERGDLASVKKILDDISLQIGTMFSGAKLEAEVAEVKAALLNEVSELDETALFTAADKGHIAKKNRSGFDPLHAAASQGHLGYHLDPSFYELFLAETLSFLTLLCMPKIEYRFKNLESCGNVRLV